MPAMSAGHAIVRTLEAHGVERLYEVPGESFLDVLDGLAETSIRTVVCRHEGGAAYAAEAEGKMLGRPGVAMVTRGPGASNAMIAVHQAWQDATPLVLFIGLVPVADRDRESFQEFDPRAWFGSTAKRVFILDDPSHASMVVAEAFRAAMSGRRGPVVIGLPEDVIREEAGAENVAPLPLADGAVSAADLDAVREALAAAERPILYTGGNAWTPDSARRIAAWAEASGIPAVTEWRANGVVPSDSPAYAGSLGYGRNDETAHAFDEADLVLAIGAVIGDVATDGYALRQGRERSTIVISPDAELLGHSGSLTRHILATPESAAAALEGVDVPASAARAEWLRGLREQQARSAELPSAEPGEGAASMSTLFARLVPELPADAMVTMGAGNHTAWAHRFFPTRAYPSLISSRNGSMGYSIPAAVAASLSFPERTVVAVCGDGEFMMNANELATARQHGANPLVIVMDNAQFGTIRSHQEHWYPGRISGTQLQNPDFAAMSEAMGGFGALVERDADVPAALEAALAAVREGRHALIHLRVDPAVLLP